MSEQDVSTAGDYKFHDIEKKWQTYWFNKKTFKTIDGGPKPKYYILDMFPYPSGRWSTCGPSRRLYSDRYSGAL